MPHWIESAETTGSKSRGGGSSCDQIWRTKCIDRGFGVFQRNFGGDFIFDIFTGVIGRQGAK